MDPRDVAAERLRFGRDEVPDLARANSYYAMAGRWPDCGWFLLDRASYNTIINANQYATDLQVVLSDYVNSNVTLSNLALVQAQCVTRGLASDTNAIYLIQVTNGKGVLHNPWFAAHTNSQYNVRAQVYDEKFYDWSMNGTAPWTWSSMLNDLWTQAPLQLGTYPGLPSTPDGTPENYIFVGVPLWEAICGILDHLGMMVAGQYPAYTIVTAGAADAAFTTLQNRYGLATSAQFCLKDDMEWIDGGSGRVPGSLTVYFHRRNQVYGTEETIRYDGPNWQAHSSYSVTVSAPASFSRAVGKAFLWDTFTVRYDQEGNPVLADVLTANTIAQQRATQFYSRIFRGTSGFMRQVYAGLMPFTPGSLVDGVRWYNSGYEPDYAGWQTEIVRGYSWPEVMFPRTSRGMTGYA